MEADDCARLWDNTLEERGTGSSTGDSGVWVRGTTAGAILSDSRLLLDGRGLAPLGLGRATLLLRRSERYEANSR